MSWAAIPPEIRDLARATLTPNEYDALRWRAEGYGYRRIAALTGTTRDTARNRTHAAQHKLAEALKQKGITLEQALRPNPTRPTP